MQSLKSLIKFIINFLNHPYFKVTSLINWSHIIWSQQVDNFHLLEERLKHVHFITCNYKLITINFLAILQQKHNQWIEISFLFWAVLYWVVIIQNVLTIFEIIGYILNFYPILTWSKPYFLLPWLYLRAIKAIYLKTLLGFLVLYLWMKEAISLALFVEFMITEMVLIGNSPVFTKCVHNYLNFKSWLFYSNS